MLALIELYDEVVRWPVRVDWECEGPASLGRRVSEEPLEAVLAQAGLSAHLVAKIEHVKLIAF
jgi:hypothetical protein